MKKMRMECVEQGIIIVFEVLRMKETNDYLDELHIFGIVLV